MPASTGTIVFDRRNGKLTVRLLSKASGEVGACVLSTIENTGADFRVEVPNCPLLVINEKSGGPPRAPENLVSPAVADTITMKKGPPRTRGGSAKEHDE